MKLFIAFGVCVTLSEAAFAQPADVIRKSPDWARGTVATDGAAVYKGPDFDAEIIEYLSYQTPLYVQKKTQRGESGMGDFNRVRYRNRAGYMANSDLNYVGKPGTAANKEQARKKSRSGEWDGEDQKDIPVYFTRYVGVAASQVNFTEKFSGKKLSDSLTMAGLRFSGPFAGPPLDVNIWFTPQKPSYYASHLGAQASGFLLFGDVDLLLPMSESKNGLLYLGLGPMWTYTNYKVKLKDLSYDSQEFRIGFDFDLGYVYRFNRFALRGDVQYFWEVTQYFGFVLSAQTEF